MELHHRPEIFNIRAAAAEQSRARKHGHSSSSGSERSYDTPPTSYSNSPTKRPPLVHYNTCENQYTYESRQYFDDRQPEQSPRSSVETYASTVPSDEDLPEELPEYDLPEYTARPYESSVVAATPSDFSALFPSKRRLAIHHDDSTIDGNMNLRVDTEVPVHGERCDMTLFHLRMHDLKNREFSLRRYCRDSGREVCHSVLKHHKPTAEKRPGFQRSLSNALQSMRPKSERKNSAAPTLASLKRNDSGYGSMHSVDFDDNDRPRSSGQDSKSELPLPTNTVKLEFSNYAQVNVKRAGVTGNKRYEFEYWGTQYAWRRVPHKDRGFKETVYHLTKAGSDQVLGYIARVPLTDRQSQEEFRKGGWIPPCSMWIADDNIVRSQKDLSDVVVASGLIALVDDNIRARFHSTGEKQLLLPKLSSGAEYAGPKRLINEMFSRSSSGNHSRASSGS